ncbi:hypothetical protein [Sulfuricystis multivorans]|uniref:hypothetical protein n=1 Tax=Sulfuricystis multivorans TaxID=2211108 RepID=UPI000F825316|nr:hypothetical protein [Sulfuricystis multivorans]
MRIMQRISAHSLAAALAFGALGLSGCASQQPAATSHHEAKAAQPAAAQKANYFLVFHDNGRLYAFSDPALYLLFLEHDEVPLTRTRIGGGPDGQTVIFGLTKKEAGLPLDAPVVAEKFFDGKIGEVGAFYGEVIYNGRYYVFGEWQDMKDFLQHKEVAWTFTEIGAGPKGETVIYALNKKTKNAGRPAPLIEAFNKLHSKK